MALIHVYMSLFPRQCSNMGDKMLQFHFIVFDTNCDNFISLCLIILNNCNNCELAQFLEYDMTGCVRDSEPISGIHEGHVYPLELQFYI